MKKKGQAVSIGTAPTIILAFGIMVLIAGAIAISLESFKSSQCTYSYDSATEQCLNSTGGTGADRGITYAFNITNDGEVGLNNFSEQVPTVGTIIGVALIIVIVIGAFAYVGLRRSGL